LPKTGGCHGSVGADGERGIWQRRFREHAIRDEKDYARHMDYVHFNPVKHGLVTSPADWPYSIFGSCAEHGRYPLDWISSGLKDVPAGAEEPGG
jgi:putative transposase